MKARYWKQTGLLYLNGKQNVELILQDLGRCHYLSKRKEVGKHQLEAVYACPTLGIAGDEFIDAVLLGADNYKPQSIVIYAGKYF